MYHEDDEYGIYSEPVDKPPVPRLVILGVVVAFILGLFYTFAQAKPIDVLACTRIDDAGKVISGLFKEGYSPSVYRKYGEPLIEAGKCQVIYIDPHGQEPLLVSKKANDVVAVYMVSNGVNVLYAVVVGKLKPAGLPI